MASHGMQWEVQEDNTLFSDKSKLLLFHLGPYTTTACLHSTTSSTCFKVVNRWVNILKFYIVPSWRLAVFPMALGWTFEKTSQSRQSQALSTLRVVTVVGRKASNRIMSGIISTRGWSYSTELRRTWCLLALSKNWQVIHNFIAISIMF